MSKYHKINWRESDTKELNRVVKNFNAKINRLAKKDNTLAAILPEKVKVSELKELIKTRQDLNRELNMLKRFSRKGSEKVVIIPDNDNNLQITKWQLTEMNRKVGLINRRRRERLEKLSNIEQKSRGESLGYKKGDIGMGKATEVSLSPMNAFTRTMSKSDLLMKWKAMMKESQSGFFTEKDFRTRENFIVALERSYNTSDIEDVISAIRKMDIDVFLNQFESEPGMFEFGYPPSQDQYEGYVSHLKSIWLTNN